MWGFCRMSSSSSRVGMMSLRVSIRKWQSWSESMSMKLRGWSRKMWHCMERWRCFPREMWRSASIKGIWMKSARKSTVWMLSWLIKMNNMMSCKESWPSSAIGTFCSWKKTIPSKESLINCCRGSTTCWKNIKFQSPATCWKGLRKAYNIVYSIVW